MPCAEHKLTICTPYFNLPAILVRNIIQLLREGKKVEIIVGDKTANDFFIPEDEPFKIIGALPYLYEINLRRFLSRLQYYVNTDQLVVRLWKDDDNTYHLKGMWVDDKWMLLTGNNLNPRAWRLDLENAILIHDPKQELTPSAIKSWSSSARIPRWLSTIATCKALLTILSKCVSSSVDYAVFVSID